MHRRVTDRRIERVGVRAPHRALFAGRRTFEFVGLAGFESDHPGRSIPQHWCLVLDVAHDRFGVWSFENEAVLIWTIRAGCDTVSFTTAIDVPASAQFDGDGAALLEGYQSAMDAGGAD